MENRLAQSKANLKNKIPDISKTLDTVKYLESKKEEEVHSYFELADNVFAQAKINKPSSVSLWLGVRNSTLIKINVNSRLMLW